MHKWKKLVAGVLSASMIIPAAPLTAGATEQVELVQQARVAPIVVNVPPPMPRVEVMPPPPGPGHVWIGGYWRWSGSRHEWVAGHWEARRDSAFWVPGHWYRSGGGWTFAGGVWQQY